MVGETAGAVMAFTTASTPAAKADRFQSRAASAVMRPTPSGVAAWKAVMNASASGLSVGESYGGLKWLGLGIVLKFLCCRAVAAVKCAKWRIIRGPITGVNWLRGEPREVAFGRGGVIQTPEPSPVAASCDDTRGVKPKVFIMSLLRTIGASVASLALVASLAASPVLAAPRTGGGGHGHGGGGSHFAGGGGHRGGARFAGGHGGYRGGGGYYGGGGGGYGGGYYGGGYYANCGYYYGGYGPGCGPGPGIVGGILGGVLGGY
jgi:hypothetical protein